jgi:hypothetical protein
MFYFSIEKKVLQRFGGSFAKQKRGTPLFLLFFILLDTFRNYAGTTAFKNYLNYYKSIL